MSNAGASRGIVRDREAAITAAAMLFGLSQVAACTRALVLLYLGLYSNYARAKAIRGLRRRFIPA